MCVHTFRIYTAESSAVKNAIYVNFIEYIFCHYTEFIQNICIFVKYRACWTLFWYYILDNASTDKKESQFHIRESKTNFQKLFTKTII